jgi:hypothetical protein
VFRIVGENKQIIQRVVIHKSLLETEKWLEHFMFNR